LPDTLGLLAPERSNHPLLWPDMRYVSRARPIPSLRDFLKCQRSWDRWPPPERSRDPLGAVPT
jgi:hypothetical protein